MPICAFCYREFQADNPRQEYCSDRCRRDADNERKRERRAEAAERRALEKDGSMAAYEAFLESERTKFRSQCDFCKHRKSKNREMLCAMCREGIHV